MRRYKWKEEEDRLLRSLISPGCLGINWKEIQLVFKAKGFIKTFKQIRLRWINNLSPELSHEKWSIAEQKRIFELYKRYGNQWKSIADEFQGRTDNGVKNMFFSVIRKALRISVKLIKSRENMSSTNVVNQIRAKVLTDFMSSFGKIKEFVGSRDESIDQALYKRDQEITRTIDKICPDLGELTVYEFINKFAFSRNNELKKELEIDTWKRVMLDAVINELLRRNELYVSCKTKNRKIKKMKKQRSKSLVNKQKNNSINVSMTEEDSFDGKHVMELQVDKKAESTENKEEYKTQSLTEILCDTEKTGCEGKNTMIVEIPDNTEETAEKIKEKEEFNKKLASIKKSSFNYFESFEKVRPSFLSQMSIIDDLSTPVEELRFSEKEVPGLIGSPYKEYMEYVSIVEGIQQ